MNHLIKEWMVRDDINQKYWPGQQEQKDLYDLKALKV